MKCTRTGSTLTFTFSDSTPSIYFNADDATVSRNDAMMHGFEQKIRDNAAIAKSADNGYNITESMRAAAIQQMVTHLTTSTDWNMRKSATVKENPVFRAIASKLGISYEEAMAKVQQQFLDEMK
ncbi:hypothetical protein UFOVP1320_22 [uncultured Caudovirales phage]|uniref:Uncharacterized protein n=1 Tax=uncultured Caudovirales phage TaxID=2100421 RepID=A0A6J5SDF8_9CAUD|nr:hypothetical protein UFOVP548_37 [uncultured Caudovirales phage]CAB4170086.1 hypothetical protein UFOVP904_37 [uncultured Caudovirales phage]CAB4182396.1 hypothetical protein UFOVP1079_18 [uncultured Caudovirales phage]CAB4197606.1 hypothetical protein UFOVP1320_22 [uncultured Caudovirales phage]CAB4211751.1 hypothetical protein UFOVP1431_33 [uncultured Caudovirales phage]